MGGRGSEEAGAEGADGAVGAGEVGDGEDGGERMVSVGVVEVARRWERTVV